MDKERLAYELYNNLRELDRIELEAMGMDMLALVKLPVIVSKELYVKRDISGRLLLIAGVQTHPSVCGGIIWLLGTKYLDEYSAKTTLLCKEMRDVKDGWLKKYKYLSNYVYEGSEKSIRWIAYLGAEFGDVIETHGNKFIHFRFKGE